MIRRFVLGVIDLMPIPEDPSRYQVFVLRCWEERGEAPPSAVWRFSLEDPGTQQRRGFAHLEALVTFLTSQFGTQTIEYGAGAHDARKEG